jgi:hypothetical protein
MWKSLFHSFMLAGAMLGVPAILWAASFGGFGTSMDQAGKTDFFTWFHLQQTGEEQTAQGTIIVFKPSGKQFRDLVTMKVTTGPDRAITGMELMLSRAFVDSKKDGIFARDIAKSLLRTAFATGADQEILDLADQIEYLGTSSQTIILHASRKPPQLPATPTPRYLTYLGQQQSYEHAAAGKTLRLKNATIDGEKALVIQIRNE